MGNQSRPKSRKESQSARKESRIGFDPILSLTIFPRLWPRLSSRLLVTNVTILLYCMVITSPRAGSSRDNTTVASWKLGALFEIFPNKKFFCKLNLTKGFHCTYLKKNFWQFFFQNGGYDGFIPRIHVFQIGWQHKWKNFHPIDSKFCTLFLLDYQVKFVPVFWYRKNCPTYGHYLTTLFWKIRTSTLNLPKCINTFNILKIWYVFY